MSPWIRHLSVLAALTIGILAGGCCRYICHTPILVYQGQSEIQVVRENGDYTVHPHTAPAWMGQQVVWSSNVPITEIMWQAPLDLQRNEQTNRPRLPDIQCNKGRTSCSIQVPGNTPYGYYPYHLILNVNGQRVTINQPELDIRG